MAKKNFAWALGGLLVLGGYVAPVLADDDDLECESVAGKVWLMPDSSGWVCSKLVTTFPDQNFLCAMGYPNPELTAFSVVVRGSLSGSGISGFTSLEPLPVSPGTFTFTARSALKIYGDLVFTADTGITANGSSIEQLNITGGSGKFAGASGTLYAFGDLLGSGGRYKGELCLPEDDDD